jgi:hypothetical protein
LAYDGAPTIDPCLSDKQLEQIQKIVEEAPSAPLRGALETTIEESADAVSVEVFRRAIAQHAGVPCQITYAEGDEGTVIVGAFCGNGPRSEQAARLYAVAKDALFSLLHMVRYQQAEIARLKANLVPQECVESVATDSEDGGL